MSDWFIWVIKQGKFDKVEAHIKTIPEIEEYVYPTTSKSYRNKKGGTIKRRTPLYSGYIFLRYKEDPETFYKLNTFPFITTYVGRCSGADLEIVKKVRELEYINTISKDIEVNDKVRVNCGPFHEFEGTVVEVNSKGVVVELLVFGRQTKTSFNKEDVDVIERLSRDESEIFGK